MWPLEQLCDFWWRLTRPRAPSLIVDARGFCVIRDGAAVMTCQWSMVNRVIAFKRDHGLYDEICLRFDFVDRLGELEISEDWCGYDQLIQELKSALPGGPDNWWETVSFPAFAENRTIIYAKI
jgi:hypothetical protein